MIRKELIKQNKQLILQNGEIKNMQHRKNSNSKGFTLIEILVVISILGLIMVVGTNMFIQVLKNNVKTEAIKDVKQNGDYAIMVMERMIRNAQNIRGCSSSVITIDNPDGRQTTFECLDGAIASRSGALSGKLTSSKVTLSSALPPASVCNSSTLAFTCDSTFQPPTVTVGFTLTKVGENLRAEEQSSLIFNQSISLRTYK